MDRAAVEVPPVLGDTFFNPRSIAMIGASADLTKIRGRLFAYTYQNGFDGDLYPVSRSHDRIGDYKAYRSIGEIGKPIDLALIVIPAREVPAAVEECAAAGVKNVMIISSGFAEEGGAATSLQDELKAIAARTGIRIAGPNSEGFFNAPSNISATFSPVLEALQSDVPEAAPDQRIGVVSQSGGLGFAVLARGRNMGLSFSTVISAGNEVDLTAADYAEWMVRDPNTSIIVVLAETVRNGPAFLRAAAAAEKAGKPMVFLKMGRSEAGARAAASHTAALTGSHDTYRAIFRRYGVLEAADLDEVVAISAALAVNPIPAGRRVGVVTASGGSGTLMADTYSEHGMRLPQLSPELQAQIEPLVPPHASAANPVDTTAQGHKTGPVSMAVVGLLDRSGEVDMITIIVSAARETSVALIPEKIREVTQRRAKPLLIWTYTRISNLARKIAAESGTVILSDMRHAAKGLAALVTRAEHLKRAPEVPAEDQTITYPAGPDVLTEYRAKEWLETLGVGASDGQMVSSAAAAVAAAEELGFPVALKVQSPDILHKSEVGGVHIGLGTPEAVAEAFEAISSSVARVAPDAAVDGVLVQPMAPRGIELVAGMINDPTFGPVMMLGMGGTAVELYGDVVHYPAPFGADRAEELLRGLKGARFFDGFRGADPVDPSPAAELIARISQIAYAGRDVIGEMEFNPIILHGDGSGVSVADAVIMRKTKV